MMNREHLKFLAIFFLFTALGFFIYSNTLDSPFVFDDLKRIKENPYIRINKLGFKEIFNAAFSKESAQNRPIGNISFALNYYFHKYDLKGYHIVNIIIHVLTGFFLYWFLKITLNLPTVRSRCQHSDLIAFFAALLWLVHPVNTQSVTYIVQRLNSMAAMFYVLSLLLYLNGRISQTKPKSWLWFVGSALSWILALGCKQNSATLPFFIFLYEWYFFQNLNREWLKHNLKYFIGIIVIFVFIAYLYLGQNPLEKITSFQDFSNKEFTFIERGLTQFRVVIYYLSLSFFPHPSRLNLDYDFPLSHSLFNPLTTLLSLCFIIGLLGLAVFLAKKERLISFSIFWFFGNLVIESSIIPLAIIFEHRLYLPSMLACLIPVALVYRYVKPEKLCIPVLGALVIICAYWTFERNRVWKDDLTIWTDTVKKSPDKARPHINLGKALEDRGMLDSAINHYSIAIRIKPDTAQVHYNLGHVLATKSQTEKAIAHYLKALQLDPGLAEAHNNLGLGLARQGKAIEAIKYYRNAVKLNPDYADAHSNLGNALGRLGQIKEALYHNTKALQMDPSSAEMHNNLGVSLMRNRKIVLGINHFQKALQINPETRKANANLKRALAIQRNFAEEMVKIREALANDPENPILHYQLGVWFYNTGNLEKTIAQFKKVLSIQPTYTRVQNELALVYAEGGEYDKALVLFQKTVQQWPDDAETYYNIAGMYSRLNRLQTSIDWLKKAVDKGYNNWNLIKIDSDLENLRKAKYFKEFIEGR